MNREKFTLKANNAVEESVKLAAANGNQAWDGKIDEVRIYDRRLSDEEILANFNVNSIFVAVWPAGKLATTWSEVK